MTEHIDLVLEKYHDLEKQNYNLPFIEDMSNIIYQILYEEKEDVE